MSPVGNAPQLTASAISLRGLAGSQPAYLAGRQSPAAGDG
jgi:hypothetical protein